jgi:hypothetical protein
MRFVGIEIVWKYKSHLNINSLYLKNSGDNTRPTVDVLNHVNREYEYCRFQEILGRSILFINPDDRSRGTAP